MQVETRAPMMVRNTEKGPTILSLDPKGSSFVEWQGSGDMNGADVQIVPDEYRQNVAFLRAVQRGILVIENADDNPDVLDAIGKQNAAWEARRQRAASEAEASIDQQANNDIVTLPCVGPNARGQGICGTDVPVRDIQKDQKPPLCSNHSDLAPQFIPEESMVNGKSQRIWTRMTMGHRETAQQ